MKQKPLSYALKMYCVSGQISSWLDEWFWWRWRWFDATQTLSSALPVWRMSTFTKGNYICTRKPKHPSLTSRNLCH